MVNCTPYDAKTKNTVGEWIIALPMINKIAVGEWISALPMIGLFIILDVCMHRGIT